MSPTEGSTSSNVNGSNKDNNQINGKKKKPLTCQFCQEDFASRNALFRHLRTNAECFAQASQQHGGNSLQRPGMIALPKQKVALRFGYHVVGSGNGATVSQNGSTTKNVLNPNEHAGALVKQVFLKSLQTLQPAKDQVDSSPTQASSAKQRHIALRQDVDCSAVSDYMGIYVQTEAIPSHFMPSLKETIQKELDNALKEQQNQQPTDGNTLQKIRLLDLHQLPLTSKYQAEQSCTQRIYHYLLPLEWLDGYEQAQEWWIQHGQQQQIAVQNGTYQPKHRDRTSQHRPPIFRKLKQALQALESHNLPEKEKMSPEEAAMIASPGRYGSLWYKERRCWHNFAHASLGGMASPSNDPVWRTIDKAKVVELISLERKDKDTANANTHHLTAVIELRGDSFVTQQVRRMMGLVVAMANDWLPLATCQMATRSDVCLETPVAPSHRQYLATNRFHFCELAEAKHTQAMWQEQTAATKTWQRELQQSMLHNIYTTNPTIHDLEQSWLQELKSQIVPRIQSQIDQITAEDQLRQEKRLRMPTSKTSLQSTAGVAYTEAPPAYLQSLESLRRIVQEEQWPRTSKARSKVIRSVTDTATNATATVKSNSVTTGSIESSFDGDRYQSGSFTVLNEALVNCKLPLGNELFPDLAKAVFDLEVALAEMSPAVAKGLERSSSTNDTAAIRPSSTHCAINRNAEFVPHVDSGRGAGQSVSMIVGLGDYTGGEILVEGHPYPIRYDPIEFDGWKQRHWTAPFEGERFSLVWFTPAGNEENVHTEGYNGEKADNAEPGATAEDRKAQGFIQEHQQKLPSFPLLQFRLNTTDALAINEVLGSERGCEYELHNHTWEGNLSPNFVLAGHDSVLDIGAHIGTFSRYALAAGCRNIIAYEPEPSNLELLRENLKPVSDATFTGSISIQDAAVAHGEPGHRSLVHARSRNDGTRNTWRHALEEYSQYMDKSIKLPSAKQENFLARTQVCTVPFFGGALVPGVSFVKMDCEGAEIDILAALEARKPESWCDVTHLVVEWSFTKEKRVKIFHQMVNNLKAAGFQVTYDGQGAWWDTGVEPNVMWPFHNDLLMFAKRKVCKS